MMMKEKYQLIRLKYLDELNSRIDVLRTIKAPPQGWLRIVREGLGLSLRAVAEKLHVRPQTIHAFEHREAVGSLTLANLRKTADAMDCHLVYFLLPKEGGNNPFTKLAASQSGFLANLLATEHSMQLEDQGVGGIDERIQSAAKTGELHK